MSICMIPARGGSKRIPRKNIKPFCGKPMIAWSIEAAQASGVFNRILVSTDDTEIAEVARACGAEVPFIRPAALSDDHATTAAVIVHMLDHLKARGQEPTAICCLYATAPFVRPDDIRTGAQMIEGADYIIPVTSFAFPIQRAVRLKGEGLEMFDSSNYATRSQDLEEAYHDAGQFYWGTAVAWRENRPAFGAGARPLILPRHRVQDIDTPEDWVRAEVMFRALQGI
ncbi:pseudaminic acid cytidylyltransferase [Pseudoruegeria sp. SHC-113]|uniref:pseudaminic acid cytidylyltransferase n=1 Tax=Pseudoruegeria sp. SHC-113 TaxID=2855439 RepID=UPI0021BBAC44|nr:pseudaminic acid cytidylyltransferase [Pseudoruegeria sp. SHC-113]MCT8161328.1 pseudaminic acid cytidylyltransferase [Pseudoruegeria sp. SHC-113]